MSTENELTPGEHSRLHSLTYPDLAATLQLNGAVNILSKAVSYGKFCWRKITLITIIWDSEWIFREKYAKMC